MSITHYFGFIYAVILEGFKYLEKPLRIENKKSIFIYLILFIWPVIHRLTGMHLNRIKWIGELNYDIPFLSNIEFLIRILFPKIPSFSNLVIGDLVLIFIMFFGCAFLIFKIKPNIIKYINKKKLRNKLNKKDILFEEVFFLTKILISFLLILSLTDLIRPISTIRNYVVLLPLVSIIIGNIFVVFINANFHSFLKKIFFCTFLSFLMILSINTSFVLIKNKIKYGYEPPQISMVNLDIPNKFKNIK